jgi:hypothetical protein
MEVKQSKTTLGTLFRKECVSRVKGLHANTYMYSIQHMPDTILGPRDIAVKKQTKSPKLTFQWLKPHNKITIKYMDCQW